MALFLNASCVLCDAAVSRGASLCQPCEADLPEIEDACQRCGLPVGDSHATPVCGQCLQSPPATDYCLSLYHYQSPVDYLITALKFNQCLSHADILGQLLLKHLQNKPQDELPQLIMPVPLHRTRLVKRGFNQSLEIARAMAKHYDIPLANNLVSRKRRTKAQVGLNVSQRRKNVRNCFELKQAEKLSAYSHIVIIDDVVTTGSTTHELAKLLKGAGVNTVGVWSIARAVLD